MSTDYGQPFDALEDGQATTYDEVDWAVVGDLLDIDFEEYDDYDYYIVDRDHPIVFIKGDVNIDGNAHTDDLATGRDGFEVDGDEWGVVVLGDLEVTGNLSLDELSPIFVTGNLKAGSVTNAYGSLVVAGTIEAGFVYLITADEGGIVHATECDTPLFIDAGGTIDSDAPGDYRLLLANGYNPREKAVLKRALEALGFDASGMTVTSAIRTLGEEREPERIDKLVELVEHFLDRKPDSVPEEAEWDDGYPSGYKLAETDEDGRPHGIHGQWAADGTVEFVKRYDHGQPHGEWNVVHNGQLYTQMYEDGELQRPEGVPEGAVWRPEQWEWELSETDDDGEKHGLTRWWRPDGTLIGETNYVNGLAQGEGRRFHESGEVSQTYAFVDDKLHGERIFHATDNFTTEHRFSKGIARAVYAYDMGTVTSVKYYDSHGNEVNQWGNPI